MEQSPSQSFAQNIASADKLNLIYTALIFLNNFAYGVSSNILGATLVDLSYVYNVSVNSISYAQVATGAGYLLGSFANLLYRWINRQLGVTFFVLFLSIIVVLIPFYGNLVLLLTMVVLGWIGTGAWDSCTSIWLVEMWPSGNAVFLQGLQMMFGLGSVVAPLLASPFVYGDRNVTDANENITPELRQHRLTTPFIVSGLIQAFVPTTFLIMFFFCRYNRPNDDSNDGSNGSQETMNEYDDDDYDEEDEYIEEEKETHEKIPYRQWKLVLIGITASSYVAGEMGFFSLGASMYQNPKIFAMSAVEANRVMSVMFISYTCSRLFTSFVSLKLKPDYIISYHFVAVLSATSILLFIGPHTSDHRLIYGASVFLGFGFAAIWPGMFAFTEYYLRLTDRVCSFYSFLSGLSTTLVPLALAQVFDQNPLILLYFLLILVAFAATLFTVTRFWIICSGPKSEPEDRDKLATTDLYRRYSIVAGPRLSVPVSHFAVAMQRRKSQIAPRMSIYSFGSNGDGVSYSSKRSSQCSTRQQQQQQKRVRSKSYVARMPSSSSFKIQPYQSNGGGGGGINGGNINGIDEETRRKSAGH